MKTIDSMMLAQKILHEELGTDWNDLCQVLYEHRILCAMLKFSDNLKNSNQNINLDKKRKQLGADN